MQHRFDQSIRDHAFRLDLLIETHSAKLSMTLPHRQDTASSMSNDVTLQLRSSMQRLEAVLAQYSSQHSSTADQLTRLRFELDSARAQTQSSESSDEARRLQIRQECHVASSELDTLEVQLSAILQHLIQQQQR